MLSLLCSRHVVPTNFSRIVVRLTEQIELNQQSILLLYKQLPMFHESFSDVELQVTRFLIGWL